MQGTESLKVGFKLQRTSAGDVSGKRSRLRAGEQPCPNGEPALAMHQLTHITAILQSGTNLENGAAARLDLEFV